MKGKECSVQYECFKTGKDIDVRVFTRIYPAHIGYSKMLTCWIGFLNSIEEVPVLRCVVEDLSMIV